MVWNRGLDGPPGGSATVSPDNHALGDEELVDRAQRDPGEFAPLYRRYIRPIYGYCLLRLGNRERAEDATSQTFERALAALPRYRAKSFRGWLFRIAHNVVIDAQRARSGMPIEEAWSVADDHPTPEQLALDADAELSVRKLLAHLSEDQREVIELDLAGVSGPEIAEILDRRPGAVRALRFRAYARLREIVGEGTDR